MYITRSSAHVLSGFRLVQGLVNTSGRAPTMLKMSTSGVRCTWHLPFSSESGGNSTAFGSSRTQLLNMFLVMKKGVPRHLNVT
jgi:hypothetical protein